MKNLILAALSRERPHPFMGYAITVLVIIAVMLLELTFPQVFHRYLPFLPVVLATALVFGRNAGIAATLLSALAANTFALISFGWRAEHWPETIFLVLYVVIGLGFAWLAEALAHAVGELRRTEAEKSLLLDELAHRTRNDLMMVATLLDVQARRHADPQVRAELDSAVARVHVIAAVQERLRCSGKQGQVELASYLQALGHGLNQLQQDVRPITVHVSAVPASVSASVAAAIGLITNELVTNAFKYAFPEGQGGTVQVTLERTDRGLALAVQDDGVGCPVTQPGGLGTRLVKMLAAQLGGELQREPASRGHHVRVEFPIKTSETTPLRRDSASAAA